MHIEPHRTHIRHSISVLPQSWWSPAVGWMKVCLQQPNNVLFQRIYQLLNDTTEWEIYTNLYFIYFSTSHQRCSSLLRGSVVMKVVLWFFYLSSLFHQRLPCHHKMAIMIVFPPDRQLWLMAIHLLHVLLVHQDDPQLTLHAWCLMPSCILGCYACFSCIDVQVHTCDFFIFSFVMFISE